MLNYYQALSDSTYGKIKDHYLGKYNKYKKHRDENEKLPPFECFYLSELIEFANCRVVIEIDDSISDLRNQTMHAHDLVNLDDPYRGDYVYTLDSFKVFFEQARVLMRDSKRVNNRIALFNLGDLE